MELTTTNISEEKKQNITKLIEKIRQEIQNNNIDSLKSLVENLKVSMKDMLAEAEKYASADREKRENIDLKNQAETLCFEAEKELSLLKENLSDEKQQDITDLIKDIRQNIQSDNTESLKSSVESLKTAMKEMMSQKPFVDNDSNSDPMSNLNDL